MIPLKIKEYIEGKTVLSSKPKVLNIEPTNFCNLNCPICVEKDTRKQGFLSLDLLKKIIKENRKVLKDQFIWLHFSGESLLHPHFSDIIRILKKNGIKARFSTNTTLLTEDISLELMKAGLDYIVFSVDGVTRETYEKIRKGASFKKVENNILNFLRIKKENSFKTEIQVQFIKMESNKEEIKAFIQKWEKTDIDYINIKSFCSRGGQVRKMEKFTNVSKIQKKIKDRPACFYLWETLIILWNGDVLACCQDLKGELKVGNVKKQSLMEIWNSPRLTEMRKRQLSGDFSMLPCSRCADWKGFPRSYIWYFFRSVDKWISKKFLNREKRDEGINIISNKR